MFHVKHKIKTLDINIIRNFIIFLWIEVKFYIHFCEKKENKSIWSGLMKKTQKTGIISSDQKSFVKSLYFKSYFWINISGDSTIKYEDKSEK